MRAIKNVTSSWNWPNLSASNCCTCPPTRPTSISSNACGNSSRRIVCTRPITTTLRSSNRPSHPVSLKLKPHTGPPSTPCFPTASRPLKNQKLCQGKVYYRPRPVSPKDLALMRRIDELHLERPFAGSRMLRDFLEREGVAVGRRHVATLMRRMGIEAIYRRRNSSKPAPGHKIYPYLLRGVKVERPNRVWATDITYIPMARGFVYLVAVGDWFTRRVLSHRVSITMDTTFCVEALEEAIGKHGRPEIFNSDQGSQFTSEAFTGVLLANGIAISMDGKGSWRDNVFVERLWKSVKYEEVYLKAYDTVAEARSSLGRYLDFYNRQRPHSSLDRRTPDEAYFEPTPIAVAA